MFWAGQAKNRPNQPNPKNLTLAYTPNPHAPPPWFLSRPLPLRSTPSSPRSPTLAAPAPRSASPPARGGARPASSWPCSSPPPVPSPVAAGRRLLSPRFPEPRSAALALAAIAHAREAPHRRPPSSLQRRHGQKLAPSSPSSGLRPPPVEPQLLPCLPPPEQHRCELARAPADAPPSLRRPRPAAARHCLPRSPASLARSQRTRATPLVASSLLPEPRSSAADPSPRCPPCVRHMFRKRVGASQAHVRACALFPCGRAFVPVSS